MTDKYRKTDRVINKVKVEYISRKLETSPEINTNVLLESLPIVRENMA